MEFLRFIKWQWNRINRDDKAFYILLLIAVASIGYTWYIGSTFITILLTAFGIFILGVAIWYLFIATEKQWNLYKKIKEQEAEEIVRKLRGTY